MAIETGPCPLPTLPVVNGRMVVGSPQILESHIVSILHGYYRDMTGGHVAGPPVEAVASCEICPTGEWRLTGDVDNLQMEIKVALWWVTVPRKIKWLSWPPMQMITLDPVYFQHTVWVREKHILWLGDQSTFGRQPLIEEFCEASYGDSKAKRFGCGERR